MNREARFPRSSMHGSRTEVAQAATCFATADGVAYSSRRPPCIPAEHGERDVAEVATAFLDDLGRVRVPRAAAVLYGRLRRFRSCSRSSRRE